MPPWVVLLAFSAVKNQIWSLLVNSNHAVSIEGEEGNIKTGKREENMKERRKINWKGKKNNKRKLKQELNRKKRKLVLRDCLVKVQDSTRNQKKQGEGEKSPL